MRLLVLGGTAFLGRHVVDAALARGHEVATFTRGRSGTSPPPTLDLRGDRDDPPSLAAALDGAGWRPEVVVDTSCQSRAAAEQAAWTLGGGGGVRAYAFTSSLNACAAWPPGPVTRDDAPGWTTDDDAYGPTKAAAERTLTAAVDGPVLLARAGLITGPYDPLGRLGWWLRRLARGGPVVVPTGLDQPVALVDARDLADWLVRGVEEGWSGPVNATAPVGSTTLGSLLLLCAEVVGRRVGDDVAFVPVPDEELLAAGVEAWTQLPLWVPAETARTLWDVATDRAQETGLVRRSVRETVTDTWAWLSGPDRPSPADQATPGLPEDLEGRLLADRVGGVR
ncbi:NAD-dependent epimerase/dehydratase family protein [Pseudokineococcus sp. 1T1Z-3]|uniref:NAD-dependent epimerase/dehydratase family protein n=1 Tax=Pseudokineococcus sp. 1T1Z-3 TaxID=3132745 RepID=UPI0030958D1B